VATSSKQFLKLNYRDHQGESPSAGQKSR